MTTSTEEKLLASKSWRRAKAHNSREELNLQKEKCRLERQVGREICQIKAAQNRFERQYYRTNSAIERKHSTTEKKRSLVLPPVKEGNDENDRLPMFPRDRRMSKSLDSFPPLAKDPLSLTWSLTGAVKRTTSVISASSSDQALSSISGDSPNAVKAVIHRRTRSFAGMPSETGSRFAPS